MAYLQALPTDLLESLRIGGETNLPPLENIRPGNHQWMGGLPLERIWRLPMLLTQGWFLCMFTVIRRIAILGAGSGDHGDCLLAFRKYGGDSQ